MAMKKTGFTLVEMLFSMVILGILFSLIVSNLTNVIPQALSRSAAEIVIADLREQQMKAMTGYESVSGGASDYGVYFEADRYVLFTGSSYQVDHPENFSVELQTGLIFDPVTLPDASVVFANSSGENLNYSADNHLITIANPSTGEQSTISINQLGVLDLL